MKINLDLIQSLPTLEKLALILEKEDLLAVDTEFVRERTFHPQLALIQVATASEIWLVDPLAFDRVQIQPLLEIFQNPRILKILHSAYGDQECFYATYQQTLSPTLDTFEAASLLGFGESISLRDLIKKLFNVSIPKFLTRTDWLKRPISNEMKRYAMSDVEYLIPLANKLIPRLESMNRKEWALELSAAFEKQGLYAANSQEIAHRLAKSGRVLSKNYGIFVELVKWREERARTLDLPRKRIADDETLINIANAKPKNLSDLAKFRGLNPGEVRRQGNKMIEILHKDYSSQKYPLPTPPRVFKASPSQARVTDFLGTYLKALCQEHKIASRLVLTAKDLKRIVLEGLEDPETWVLAGICSKRAAELVGMDLRAVLRGERAMAVQDGKLKILEI